MSKYIFLTEEGYDSLVK